MYKLWFKATRRLGITERLQGAAVFAFLKILSPAFPSAKGPLSQVTRQKWQVNHFTLHWPFIS